MPPASRAFFSLRWICCTSGVYSGSSSPILCWLTRVMPLSGMAAFLLFPTMSRNSSEYSSNCGQFMAIPTPWLLDHHLRSLEASAFWIVCRYSS
uniref:Putative secreted protein n=1 Tax=Ixodes ricinus TaxID=34613 RepID=A0A6B0U8U3_IXORI